jgi:hypothetical protein
MFYTQKSVLPSATVNLSDLVRMITRYFLLAGLLTPNLLFNIKKYSYFVSQKLSSEKSNVLCGSRVRPHVQFQNLLNEFGSLSTF